jgi:hypothetical protein
VHKDDPPPAAVRAQAEELVELPDLVHLDFLAGLRSPPSRRRWAIRVVFDAEAPCERLWLEQAEIRVRGRGEPPASVTCAARLAGAIAGFTEQALRESLSKREFPDPCRAMDQERVVKALDLTSEPFPRRSLPNIDSFYQRLIISS